MSILDIVPKIISDAMGESLFRAGTIYTASGSSFDCSALVTSYSDYARLREGIPAKDRLAMIIAYGLAITPKAGDILVVEGEAWKLVRGKRDPAAATYEFRSTRAPMPAGDTTITGGVNLLDLVPSLMNDAMGSSIFRPATLYQVTSRVSDGRGGFVGRYGSRTCSALIVDYDDDMRGLDDIPSKDRRAIILAASIEFDGIPRPGDVIEIEGAGWILVTVDRDPAKASYEGQASPSPIPATYPVASLNVTLENVQTLIRGAPTITASLVATLQDAIGSTDLGTNYGTLAVTLEGATLVSAASPVIAASLVATLADATPSAAGHTIVTGATSQTLAAATLVSTGWPVITATLAATLQDATGSPGNVAYGSLNVTLEDASLVATGWPVVTGSLVVTLADATLISTGRQPAIASLAATLADATLVSTGSPVTKATLSATLEDAIAVSNGSPTVTGTLARTLDDATLISTARQPAIGSLTQTLGDATVSSTGWGVIAGSLVATLGDATLISSASPTITASLTVTLEDATLAATGTVGSASTPSFTPFRNAFIHMMMR